MRGACRQRADRGQTEGRQRADRGQTEGRQRADIRGSV